MKKLSRLLIKNKYPTIFIILVCIFFYKFFIYGELPIPVDTIVGMYHPFRDVIWNGLTAGVPFKNYLITDPVRQLLVWRDLSLETLFSPFLPLWNPYAFSGMPLLANFQTAVFYPMNVISAILSFSIFWSVGVFLQPILSGIFMYLFLSVYNLKKLSRFLAAIVFSFSGFPMAWLEWNSVIHTGLWLPFILFCIEKLLFLTEKNKTKDKRALLFERISSSLLFWTVLLIFALSSSFFAGHLQTFFYLVVIVFVYSFFRLLYFVGNRVKPTLILLMSVLIFVFVTSIQWFPTLRLILNSSRLIHSQSYLSEGWFIPIQNLVQFIAPDFFGNPSTGNYYGIWNYAEFVGYVGIIPLILAFYSIFFRFDRKTFFYGAVFFLSLIFALPNFISKLPFVYNIPFISSSQPTRLLYLVDFSLSVLCGLGLDLFIKRKKIRQISFIVLFFAFVIIALWLILFLNNKFMLPIDSENLRVSKRNLILPSIMLVFTPFVFIMLSKKSKLFSIVGSVLIVCIVVFDLFRFGLKFNTFSNSQWLFPQTKIINYLQKNSESFRIMTLDRRILPPNFSVYYRLQDVAGYDPLYLSKYARLVSSWETNAPSEKPGYFARIITPQNTNSFFPSLLGVKYFLTIGERKIENTELVLKEGNTFLYENKEVFPRVFFAEGIEKVEKGQELDKMFKLDKDLRRLAVVTNDLDIQRIPLDTSENTYIETYTPNQIVVETSSNKRRLLVLTDIHYPSWKAFIDGVETSIIEVDYLFRGVVTPQGKHEIIFKTSFL